MATEGAEFIAGWIGGAVGTASGQPLDTVRIRMQVGGASSETSFMAVFRALVEKEGLLALFKGLSAPVLAIAFQNAVTFAAYTNAKRHLWGWDDAAAGALPPRVKSSHAHLTPLHCTGMAGALR